MKLWMCLTLLLATGAMNAIAVAEKHEATPNGVALIQGAPDDRDEDENMVKPRRPMGQDGDERRLMRPQPKMGEDGEMGPPDGHMPGGKQGDRERPDRPMNPRGHEEDMRPLTEDQIEEALAFLKENMPERVEELKRLKEENKKAFLNKIRQAYNEMKMLRQLKQDHPDEYERIMKERSLERTSWQIAEKLRSLKKHGKEGGTEAGGDNAELRKKLKNVLSELFEIREAQRAREIEEIEKRLSELKSRMEKRKKSKDDIVERRLKEMTGERTEDEMEW